jgi:hypothetical protein
VVLIQTTYIQFELTSIQKSIIMFISISVQKMYIKNN